MKKRKKSEIEKLSEESENKKMKYIQWEMKMCCLKASS